jgi:hypothetical protein
MNRGFVESARFLGLASELARVGYWRLDVRTDAIHWSEYMYEIFGLEPGQEQTLTPRRRWFTRKIAQRRVKRWNASFQKMTFAPASSA